MHYLTFSTHRAARLAGVQTCSAADLEVAAAALDLRDLRHAASGDHGDEDSALRYAAAEGPALVLFPDGHVVRVERARDAAADDRVAAEEREWADRRPARRLARRGEG